MLVLQVLIVPFIALVLVGITFVIGAAGTGLPGYSTQTDLTGAWVDEPDPTRIVDSPSSAPPVQ